MVVEKIQIDGYSEEYMSNGETEGSVVIAEPGGEAEVVAPRDIAQEENNRPIFSTGENPDSSDSIQVVNPNFLQDTEGDEKDEAASQPSQTAEESSGDAHQEEARFRQQLTKLPEEMKTATTQAEVNEQITALAQQRLYEVHKKRLLAEGKSDEEAEQLALQAVTGEAAKQVETFWEKVRRQARKKGYQVTDDMIKDLGTGNFQQLLETLFGPEGSYGVVGGGTESSISEKEAVGRNDLLEKIYDGANGHVIIDRFVHMLEDIYGKDGLNKPKSISEDRWKRALVDKNELKKIIDEFAQLLAISENWSGFEQGLEHWWKYDSQIGTGRSMHFVQKDFKQLIYDIKNDFPAFFPDRSWQQKIIEKSKAA